MSSFCSTVDRKELGWMDLWQGSGDEMAALVFKNQYLHGSHVPELNTQHKKVDGGEGPCVMTGISFIRKIL